MSFGWWNWCCCGTAPACSTYKNCHPSLCFFTVPYIWKLTPSASTTASPDPNDDCDNCCGGTTTPHYIALPERIDGRWPIYDPDTGSISYDEAYWDKVPAGAISGCRWMSIHEGTVSENGRFKILQSDCGDTECDPDHDVRYALASPYVLARWSMVLLCGDEDAPVSGQVRLQAATLAEWYYLPGGFPNIPVGYPVIHATYSTAWMSQGDMTTLLAGAVSGTPITLNLETYDGKDFDGVDNASWAPGDFTASDPNEPPSPLGCGTMPSSVEAEIPTRALLRLLAGCDQPCNPYPTKNLLKITANIEGSVDPVVACLSGFFNEDLASIEFLGGYSPLDVGPSCGSDFSISFRVYCSLEATDAAADATERVWMLDVTYKGDTWTIPLTATTGFAFTFSDTLDAVCGTDDLTISGTVEECESEDPDVCCPPEPCCGIEPTAPVSISSTGYSSSGFSYTGTGFEVTLVRDSDPLCYLTTRATITCEQDEVDPTLYELVVSFEDFAEGDPGVWTFAEEFRFDLTDCETESPVTCSRVTLTDGCADAFAADFIIG